MPHQRLLSYTSEARIKAVIKSSDCLMRVVWQAGCYKNRLLQHFFFYCYYSYPSNVLKETHPLLHLFSFLFLKNHKSRSFICSIVLPLV